MTEFALLPLLHAAWETFYMVFISGFLSVFGGLSLGLILFLSRPKQVWANQWINYSLGFLVNLTRSIPFIILLVSIIPLTRLIVGTSIGTNAAILPLTLAAIPFYARIAEAAFTELSPGLLEAANAIGINTWQLIYKILIPESLPALIKGATLTFIGLIGYSAMAGAVGGGGLGELAINYGYQRFNGWVMLETVVILVVMVQIIQSAGDYFSKCKIQYKSLKILGAASIFVWMICIATQLLPYNTPADNTLKIGIMSGIQQNIMKAAQRVALKDYGLRLQLVPFDDYILPNTALNNGDISANIFQHVPYLEAQIKARGYQLTPIGKTFVYPMGFYSQKIKKLSQLTYGDSVAVPNDPSNEGRALLILQTAHLITLRSGAGLFGTAQDIINNPKHLRFIELAAAQLPRSMKDAALVALTDDYVKPAGFKPSEALLREGPDSPYANVIVVRTADKNNPVFKKLIAVMHSKAILEATLKAYPDGAAIPAWTVVSKVVSRTPDTVKKPVKIT